MADSFLLAMGAHVAVTAAGQGLLKLMTRSLPRAKALALMYCILATSVISFNWMAGWPRSSAAAGAVVLLGVLVSFGAQCSWQAYSFSLSRTSLLLPLAPIWGSVLAALFLAEPWRSDPVLLAGIILLHAAAFVIAWRRRETGEAANLLWLVFTLTAVTIFGVAMFLTKACSSGAMPARLFLMYWYSGGMIGATVVAMLERETGQLWQKHAWQVPLAGLCVLGSLGTLYWVFSTAQAGLVLSIKSFSEASSGMLMGWYIFRETQQLSRLRVCGFGMGLMGLAIIVLSWLKTSQAG